MSEITPPPNTELLELTGREHEYGIADIGLVVRDHDLEPYAQDQADISEPELADEQPTDVQDDGPRAKSAPPAANCSPDVVEATDGTGPDDFEAAPLPLATNGLNRTITEPAPVLSRPKEGQSLVVADDVSSSREVTRALSTHDVAAGATPAVATRTSTPVARPDAGRAAPASPDQAHDIDEGRPEPGALEAKHRGGQPGSRRTDGQGNVQPDPPEAAPEATVDPVLSRTAAPADSRVNISAAEAPVDGQRGDAEAPVEPQPDQPASPDQAHDIDEGRPEPGALEAKHRGGQPGSRRTDGQGNVQPDPPEGPADPDQAGHGGHGGDEPPRQGGDEAGDVDPEGEDSENPDDSSMQAGEVLRNVLDVARRVFRFGDRREGVGRRDSGHESSEYVRRSELYFPDFQSSRPIEVIGYGRRAVGGIDLAREPFIPVSGYQGTMLARLTFPRLYEGHIEISGKQIGIIDHGNYPKDAPPALIWSNGKPVRDFGHVISRYGLVGFEMSADQDQRISYYPLLVGVTELGRFADSANALGMSTDDPDTESISRSSGIITVTNDGQVIVNDHSRYGMGFETV